MKSKHRHGRRLALLLAGGVALWSGCPSEEDLGPKLKRASASVKPPVSSGWTEAFVQAKRYVSTGGGRGAIVSYKRSSMSYRLVLRSEGGERRVHLLTEPYDKERGLFDFLIEVAPDGRCAAYSYDKGATWRFVLRDGEESFVHFYQLTRKGPRAAKDPCKDVPALPEVLRAAIASHSKGNGFAVRTILRYLARHADAEPLHLAFAEAVLQVGLPSRGYRHLVRYRSSHSKEARKLQRIVCAKARLKAAYLAVLRKVELVGDLAHTNAGVMLSGCRDREVQDLLARALLRKEKTRYEADFRERLVRALASVTDSLGSASPETGRAIATYFEKRYHQPRPRLDLVWTLAVIDSADTRAALKRFVDKAAAKKRPAKGPLPPWPPSLQEYRRRIGKTPHRQRFALALRYARAALERGQKKERGTAGSR